MVEQPTKTQSFVVEDNRIEILNVQREFKLYKPKKVDKILVVLHGGGGSYNRITNNIKLLDYFSENDGVLIIVPNAIDGNWNDGRVDKDRKIINPSDDNEFIAALIKKYKSEYNLDSSKIYMAGLSNGGIFTHQFACTQDIVNSIFTVVANFPKLAIDYSMCSDSVESVVMLNSPQDTIVPYLGGYIGSARQRRGEVFSVDYTRSLWEKTAQDTKAYTFTSGHEWPINNEINATELLRNFVLGD